MKRHTLLIVLLCCMLLAGCGKTENPYRVDTVVRIPVDPTDASTEPEAATEPAETEAPTEATEPAKVTEPTEGKTESSGKKPTSTKKPTTTKKPTSDSKQESAEPTKSTEPEATEAPATEPATEPETQPPTEAVVTEASTEPPYDPSDYSVGSLEKAILKEMNTYRTEAGLSELSMSNRLSGIAALRAEEALEIWSHTRPDGREFTTAMSDYGYGFATSAEDLVHVGGSGDAAAIVAKWMDTDSKDNILNENFTTVGIGVYRSGGVTFVASLLVG